MCRVGCHGRAGIASLAGWSDVAMMMLFRLNGARSSRSSRCKLSVPGVSVLASEEALLAGARGITVGGGWTITLLFLVMSHEEHLEKSTEKEESTSREVSSSS